MLAHDEHVGALAETSADTLSLHEALEAAMAKMEAARTSSN